MVDINEKFSINWLVGRGADTAGAATQQDVGSSALDEAFYLYSQPIIDLLRTPDNKQVRMHDLVKEVNELISVRSFDEFRTVINRLAERGLIDVVETDSLTGNDLLQWHKK